jgi:hypothetical protein
VSWTTGALIGGILTMIVTAAAAETAEQKVMDEARKDCSSFENGVLATTRKAIPRIDLTGDGIPDTIIDSHEFRCSTSASMYCGTGGCSLWVIVGDTSYPYMAKGWKIVEWANSKILLLEVHGSECGGTNLRKCIRAEVWSDGGFYSVGDR